MFCRQNKYKKKGFVIEFETLCSSVNKDISLDDNENVHKFLTSATNRFTHNI